MDREQMIKRGSMLASRNGRTGKVRYCRVLRCYHYSQPAYAIVRECSKTGANVYGRSRLGCDRKSAFRVMLATLGAAYEVIS